MNDSNVSPMLVRCTGLLLALTLLAPSSALLAQQARSGATDTTRQRILQMFARTWFPGRTGQIFIAPREGDILTKPDVYSTYMHGSPWTYDVSIPILFAGPTVKSGVYASQAAQQDIAPTLAAALGVRMPATSTGHVLPVLRNGVAPPRAVFLIVLDAMRRDYFDRYAAAMPTLTALRKRGAWFSQARVNFLPTNTAVGHSTIATGTDPGVHGITGNNLFSATQRKRVDLFVGFAPRDLMALSLADVWKSATGGRAIVIAQGSVDRAATPLAGHGACQLNGTPVILAGYDPQTGNWASNSECFVLPAYLKERNVKSVYPLNGEWMGHRVDSTTTVRYSALFPTFEGDAITALIDNEPIGQDSIPDLIQVNFKAADYAGHRYGPDSAELRATLAEIDRQIARALRALEAKVGSDYLIAITADHGMPAEPSAPDRRHFAAAIVDLLHNRFDPQAKQLISFYEPENDQIFVDENRLSALNLTLKDLARFLETQPFVFAAFTNDEVRRAVTGARVTTSALR